MREIVFYTPGGSPALDYAKDSLSAKGVVFSPVPGKEVTHLLLGVPVKNTLPPTLLEELPPDITVFGGKLDLPAGYKKYDLLQDPFYVSENADITARCALHLAAGKLPVTLKNCPVLVIGWGRIGKCLAKLLKAQDALVTVAARKPEDRGMLRALGYRITTVQEELSGYRVLFNTADGLELGSIPPDCLKIDLATVRSIHDPDALWARGLPGSLAPESSGRLIAETVLRLIS